MRVHDLGLHVDHVRLRIHLKLRKDQGFAPRATNPSHQLVVFVSAYEFPDRVLRCCNRMTCASGHLFACVCVFI